MSGIESTLNLDHRKRSLYFTVGHATQTVWDEEVVCGQTRSGDQVDCGQMDIIHYRTMLVILEVRLCLFCNNNTYIFCPGYNETLPGSCAGVTLGKCHNLTDYLALSFTSF